MIRHNDKERYIVIIIIAILCNIPLIYSILKSIINVILTHSFAVISEYSVGFIIYALILIIADNSAKNIINESSFVIRMNSQEFTHKTILSREIKFSVYDVKKVAICKEYIVLGGEHESLIITLKRHRRTIFINHLHMNDNDYKRIKEFFINISSAVVQSKKSLIYKQLCLFFKL